MPRVTDDLLRTVINLPSDVVTSTFIDTASVFVGEVLVDSGLSEAMLTKIELYLAAHFAALLVENGGLVRSAVGDAAETYANIYDKGLRATRFGQQAIVLDTTGTLAVVTSQKLKAQLQLIYTPDTVEV